MRPFGLTGGSQQPLKILALGAHSDDIEIGCGGTLLTLLSDRRDVEVHWCVFNAIGPREIEARRSAAAFLERASKHVIHLKAFRDGFMNQEGVAVKEFFEELKGEVSPDVVFTHRLEDRHQDHRLLADLTWNTFRDHVILEYEIPKYEGDLGHPNVFVPLRPEIHKRKVDLLIEHFGTQRSKRWFREEVFSGLMHLRGIEAGLAGGTAEGFYVRKAVWDPAFS